MGLTNNKKEIIKIMIIIIIVIIIRDYYMTFSISALVLARYSHIKPQRSWRADMGRGLIPGTIWKISCHNLFITYFTLTLSKL